MNQDFISISLPKNIRSRKTVFLNYGGALGLAKAIPNHGYAWSVPSPIALSLTTARPKGYRD
jgi:hypothetical protein